MTGLPTVTSAKSEFVMKHLVLYCGPCVSVCVCLCVCNGLRFLQFSLMAMMTLAWSNFPRDLFVSYTVTSMKSQVHSLDDFILCHCLLCGSAKVIISLWEGTNASGVSPANPDVLAGKRSVFTLQLTLMRPQIPRSDSHLFTFITALSSRSK